MATLYVCGEPERALALARDAGVDDVSVRLARIERDGDRRRCDAWIASGVKRIVAERLAPAESSGQVAFDDRDRLELGFAVRARIAGEAVPDHRWHARARGAARRRTAPTADRTRVVARFSVTAADASAIEARVDHEDPRWIAIVLDPRDDHQLSLDLSWGDGVGYQLSVTIDPESSPQERLAYEGTDFREAIGAAADRFGLEDDLGGRDGPWAARTLPEITRDLPVPPVDHAHR